VLDNLIRSICFPPAPTGDATRHNLLADRDVTVNPARILRTGKLQLDATEGWETAVKQFVSAGLSFSIISDKENSGETPPGTWSNLLRKPDDFPSGFPPVDACKFRRG
jgi:hypothetical protein